MTTYTTTAPASTVTRQSMIEAILTKKQIGVLNSLQGLQQQDLLSIALLGKGVHKNVATLVARDTEINNIIDGVKTTGNLSKVALIINAMLDSIDSNKDNARPFIKANHNAFAVFGDLCLDWISKGKTDKARELRANATAPALELWAVACGALQDYKSTTAPATTAPAPAKTRGNKNTPVTA